MKNENLKPPYYAVIFTAKMKKDNDAEYLAMTKQMRLLVEAQKGYLGMESVSDQSGQEITISYWASLDDITNWKKNSGHLQAQALGKKLWYENYHVRICKIEREYGDHHGNS